MAKTESATNVYGALLAARSKFNPVLKNKENSHFKNRYADLQAVLDAADDALAEAGLVLVQTTDVRHEGTVLLTRLHHVGSGTEIVSTYPLVAKDAGNPQALGGSLTYARRYQALAILGLAPEDDDGQQASRPAPKKQAQAQPLPKDDATPAEDAEVHRALRYLGEAKDEADLKSRFRALGEDLKMDRRVVDGAKAIKATLSSKAVA
jgi:hypothetical protein